MFYLNVYQLGSNKYYIHDYKWICLIFIKMQLKCLTSIYIFHQNKTVPKMTSQQNLNLKFIIIAQIVKL